MKKKLKICLSLLIVLSIAGYFTLTFLIRLKEKAVLREQAVWMARYLGVTSGDLALAKGKLREDQPYHTLNLAIWSIPNEDQKELYGSDIIAIGHIEGHDSFPIIRKDYSIYWINNRKDSNKPD